MQGGAGRFVVIPLLVLNLIATSLLAIYVLKPGGGAGEIGFEFYEDGQYVLHIGLNDKDTGEQIISTDEAEEILNDICAKYLDGWTISRGEGGWVDNDGVLVRENTLICVINFADEKDVKAVMDEALVALNQDSILVEGFSISGDFYGSDN